MSLACWECRQIGTFNTLVLFERDGAFDLSKETSEYPNFYTCCASFHDFKTVGKSRFMVVEQPLLESQWSRSANKGSIAQAKYKLVDEAELRARVPKICETLAKR